MVDSAFFIIRELVIEFGPRHERKIDFCENPPPEYLAQGGCPKTAPFIPRRRSDF
jgi:hypothetical protein